MTCNELKEQAAALALGVLEPDERDACLAHLEEERPHEGCPEAVERALAAASEIAAILPDHRVPTHLWRGIAAQIAASERRVPAAQRLWRGFVGWVAGAHS